MITNVYISIKLHFQVHCDKTKVQRKAVYTCPTKNAAFGDSKRLHDKKQVARMTKCLCPKNAANTVTQTKQMFVCTKHSCNATNTLDSDATSQVK